MEKYIADAGFWDAWRVVSTRHRIPNEPMISMGQL